MLQIFFPFILAFISLFTAKAGRWITILFALICAAAGLNLLFNQEIHRLSSLHFEILKSHNLQFGFLIDGLSVLFMFLIFFIGAFILIYNGEYLKGRKQQYLQFLLLFFMGSMAGIACSDNLIMLFIFWELTSITSFLMIGIDHQNEIASTNARMAILTTGGGGIAMMGGILLLQSVTGTFLISEMLDARIDISNHFLFVPAVILILLGAFTKSAQFPFHYWLPSAMVAPTPVSAYLHSATMVKAGVFLIMRLNPIFQSYPVWKLSLIVVGGFTMLMAAVVAVGKDDLKEMLAYSTISSLGLMILFTGLGYEKAYVAAVTYLLIHALYKAALFMVAGIIDHSTGSRSIKNLSGLRKSMPFVALASLFALLSYAGFPPALGYAGKEIGYAAAMMSGQLSAPLIITFISNICIVATAFLTGFSPFVMRNQQADTNVHHKPGILLSFGPMIMGIIGLIAGIFNSLTAAIFIDPAVSAVAGFTVSADLGLWHGFNTVFITGLLTLGAGATLFIFRYKMIGFFLLQGKVFQFSVYYDKLVDGLGIVSKAITSSLQTGNLRHYIIWLFSTLIVLCTYSYLSFPVVIKITEFAPVSIYKVIVCLLILAGAATAVRLRNVMGALASLGVVGYGIALLFVFFGAPDLAMTQFTAETLSVLLFVLVVYRYPNLSTLKESGQKWKDGIIAIISGLFMFISVLLIILATVPSRVKNYYLENSYTLGQGKNVVNVILVDFRSMDTLGEVTVLAVAAIGVFSLLKLKLNKEA
ncbi:MAG: hydrogen gas-evolving membrane-bound hydrogenase subunit E [Cytophagaceae bacterium]